jgi:hypothetical protein
VVTIRDVSVQGWRGFLAAQDVNDRAVLHGGAAAVLLVPSPAEAAGLAEAVARTPEPAQDA